MIANLFRAGVVPHARQRYCTTGDWEFLQFQGDDTDVLNVTVSDMKNPNYEFLVAIHETIEAWLCRAAGITDEQVTSFDECYESARLNHSSIKKLFDVYLCDCTPTETSEPGDDIHAPYYHEHQIATGVERILAAELNVSWNDHEATQLKLSKEQ